MVKIYCWLILAGERTLESVPERWRQEVADLLAA